MLSSSSLLLVLASFPLSSLSSLLIYCKWTALCTWNVHNQKIILLLFCIRNQKFESTQMRTQREHRDRCKMPFHVAEGTITFINESHCIIVDMACYYVQRGRRLPPTSSCKRWFCRIRRKPSREATCGNAKHGTQHTTQREREPDCLLLSVYLCLPVHLCLAQDKQKLHHYQHYCHCHYHCHYHYHYHYHYHGLCHKEPTVTERLRV